MALEFDPDVNRKLTKLALAGYTVMFLLSPV